MGLSYYSYYEAFKDTVCVVYQPAERIYYGCNKTTLFPPMFL